MPEQHQDCMGYRRVNLEKKHQPRHSGLGWGVAPEYISRPPPSAGLNWGHRSGGMRYSSTTGLNLPTSLSAGIGAGGNYPSTMRLIAIKVASSRRYNQLCDRFISLSIKAFTPLHVHGNPLIHTGYSMRSVKVHIAGHIRGSVP